MSENYKAHWMLAPVTPLEKHAVFGDVPPGTLVITTMSEMRVNNNYVDILTVISYDRVKICHGLENFSSGLPTEI